MTHFIASDPPTLESRLLDVLFLAGCRHYLSWAEVARVVTLLGQLLSEDCGELDA